MAMDDVQNMEEQNVQEPAEQAKQQTKKEIQ